MDFSTLHKQRKFVLVAAAVGTISCFLPWASALGFTVANGLHGKGILVFMAFIAAGVISLLGKTTDAFDKAMWMAVLIAGAIALLFTVLFMTDISGAFGASIGFGLWIALLSSIGVLASAWAYKSPSDTLQGGFDSLKNKVSSSLNSTGTSAQGSSPGKVDELERLIKLRDEGKITQEEYEDMKSKIM